MTGIGHNGGPDIGPGQGFRRYAWKKARAELLPKLPLEIVRIRVKRAKDLGLDYKSYAGFRAANGRDIVAFLFSTSALRAMPSAKLPQDRVAHLSGIQGADRLALAPKRLCGRLAQSPVLDAVGEAPDLTDSLRNVRRKVRAVTTGRALPGDGVLVVGDTALDREWFTAARLGGYLPAHRYFGDHP